MTDKRPIPAAGSLVVAAASADCLVFRNYKTDHNIILLAFYTHLEGTR